MKLYQTSQHYDLGNDPIVPLLIKMSMPSIVAMLVMSLYNIIDTFWIAQISPAAIAGLTICFPIQMIFGAIGVGTGIGAGSFASRMFGAGENEMASRTAGQIALLSLAFGIVMMIVGTFLPAPILKLFGATPDILLLARQYFSLIVFGTPGLFFMMMSGNLFRAEGKPALAMYVMITSAVINAILDPLLIFGLGPCPALGIRGAAVATVIAQNIALLLSGYFLMDSDSRYQVTARSFFPDVIVLSSIYRVGFPAMITNVAMSLVLTIYNHTLGSYGPNAIAAMGLLFRINGVFMMVLFGMGHGVMPMVGFNFGALNYRRLVDIVKTSARYASVIGVASTLVIEIFSRPLIMAFTRDPVLLGISIPALRIYVSTQFLIGPFIIFINMFNGIGKGTTSMTLLLMRQMIFVIPLLSLLPLYFGLIGVWMAQPISNILSLFIIAYWTRREFRCLTSL